MFGVGGRIVMGRIFHYLNDEGAATAAEYALILAIISAAVALACFSLGNAIATAADRAATCLGASSTGGNCA